MASDIIMTVDVALTGVPVNLHPLTDDTDFKTREESVVYNQAGLDLVWNFVTVTGVATQTAVTPTTAGDYDWTNLGNGLYTIEIPASGGASINNDTEGTGWFTGYATGILPWTGPRIQFVPANVSAALVTGGDYLDVSTVQIEGTDATDVLDNKAKHETTIATLASQTSFTLTAGSTDNTTYQYWTAIITDSSTSTQKAVGFVSAYVGSSKTITLASDPGIFTMAVGDTVTLYPPSGANVFYIDTNTTAVTNLNTAANGGSYNWGGGGIVAASVTGATGSVTGSVGSVTGAVGSVTGNVGGNVTGSVGSISGVTFPTNFAALDITANTGYVTLASTGLDQITPLSPSAVPAFNTTTLPQWIAYFGLWSTAEVNVTANTVVVRNAADSADLATHSTSDNGTTFSSGAAS